MTGDNSTERRHTPAAASGARGRSSGRR